MLVKPNFKELLTKKTFLDSLPTEKELSEHTKKVEEEYLTEKKQFLKRSSNLPKQYLHKNLKDLLHMLPGQKKAIEFLTSWDPKERSFCLPYLFGPHGTGKSHIAKTFINTAIETTVQGTYFITMPSFFISARNNPQRDYMSKLLQVYILILDDFGSQNITKHSMELLHSIIDHRLNEKLPTFITSNFSIIDIAKKLSLAGGNNGVSKESCLAIEDRIFELCVPFELKGESLRLKTALNRRNSHGV